MAKQESSHAKKDHDRRFAEATAEFLSRPMPDSHGSSEPTSVYEALISLQDRLSLMATNLRAVAPQKYRELEGLEDHIKDIEALDAYSWRLNDPIRAGLRLAADARREQDDTFARIHGEATDMTIASFKALPKFLEEIEAGVSNLVPDNLEAVQKGELYRPIKAKKSVLRDIEYIQEAYYRTVEQVGVSKNSAHSHHSLPASKEVASAGRLL